MTQFDSYTCERCRRFYLVVRDDRDQASSKAAERSHCACGGELRAVELAAGMYEAVPRKIAEQQPPRAPGEQREIPEIPSSVSQPPEAQEADLGYGKSHGYAPGHGGPSGPGDAPAAEPGEPSRSKKR